jgi:hypothetical protein
MPTNDEGRKLDNASDRSRTREYRSPELRRWGTLKELTRGAFFGTSDTSITGSAPGQ